MEEAVPVLDVDIQQAPTWPVKMGPAYDGALTCIHGVKAESTQTEAGGQPVTTVDLVLAPVTAVFYVQGQTA